MSATSIEALERDLQSLSLTSAARVLFEFSLNEKREVLAADLAQLPDFPRYKKPELKTRFSSYHPSIPSSSIPPIREFWSQLLQRDALKEVAAWFEELKSKGTPVIVSRRRCLKNIWTDGLLKNEYQRSKFTTQEITLLKDGSVVWLDIPREVDDAVIEPGSALAAGLQFENICTVGGEKQPTGLVPGFFTAVTDTLSLPEGKECVLILLGEVDCKTADGRYVELKCKSSSPKFWPLTFEERLLHWVASELNLARLLVRGHRNKFSDILDKLEEEQDTSKFLSAAAAEKMRSFLAWRLQQLVSHPEVKASIPLIKVLPPLALNLTMLLDSDDKVIRRIDTITKLK